MDALDNPKLPFEAIEAKLTKDDDRALWREVLAVVSEDFLRRYDDEGSAKDWVLVVGACSHWVRPNQTRWTAAGGFAHPEGYKDSSPDLDWFVVLLLRNRQWIPLQKVPGKRLKTLRVAIPTRTSRHKQAAINAEWNPDKETVLYGFRNVNGLWKCVAASDEKLRGRIDVSTQIPN